MVWPGGGRRRQTAIWDGVNDQLRANVIGDRPADNATAVGVEDGGHIDLALAGGVLGHVHHPQLVGPVRVELAADQIVRWFRAVAAGAAMATPPIDALDVGLAHEPLDLLARAADLLIAQA